MINRRQWLAHTEFCEGESFLQATWRGRIGQQPRGPHPWSPHSLSFTRFFFFFIYLFYFCLFVKGGLDWAWAQSDGIPCYLHPLIFAMPE
jgi:hypothetical protein